MLCREPQLSLDLFRNNLLGILDSESKPCNVALGRIAAVNRLGHLVTVVRQRTERFARMSPCTGRTNLVLGLSHS